MRNNKHVSANGLRGIFVTCHQYVLGVTFCHTCAAQVHQRVHTKEPVQPNEVICRKPGQVEVTASAGTCQLWKAYGGSSGCAEDSSGKAEALLLRLHHVV